MPEALPPASTTRRGVDPSKFMGSSFAAGKQLEKRVETNEKKITILKNILKMRQQSQNIGKTLDGIQESVAAIAETTDLQYQHDLDEKEDNRLATEKSDAKKRETKLEKVSSTVAKGTEKILAPVKGFMQKIGDFLLKVLLGASVIKMMEWFGKKENTEKISSLFRFLKDWWPAIVAGLIAFLPGLLGPAGVIIGVIALLAWAIPKIINAVKSVFGMGKDADKIISKEGSNLNKELKEGSNIQKQSKDLDKEIKPIDTGEIKEVKSETTDDAPKGTQPTGVLPEQLQDLQQPEQKFNEGGVVQGPGGVDKVPARLSAGEFVMSKGAVQKYGVDTLAGMNAAGKGTNQPINGAYNGGGLVDLSNNHSSVDNRSHTTKISGINVDRSVDVRPTQSILPYEGKEYHKKFQFGGKVTGPGGEDKVPAKLTAGEFVMSKSAVKAFGANTFAAMNASGGGTNVPLERHYAGGGFVAPPSSNERMNPPSPPSSKGSRVKVVPITVPSGGGGPSGGAPVGKTIPPFSVRTGGGTNKEEVLGIRR